MLGGLAAVYQASVLDGLSFVPFSFQQDGLAAPEADVGRGEVGDGLVVSQVVVVGAFACVGITEVDPHRHPPTAVRLQWLLTAPAEPRVVSPKVAPCGRHFWLTGLRERRVPWAPQATGPCLQSARAVAGVEPE